MNWILKPFFGIALFLIKIWLTAHCSRLWEMNKIIIIVNINSIVAELKYEQEI